MPETEVRTLRDVLREMADATESDPLMNAAITASVSTLNWGIWQDTTIRQDPALRRKHHARLSAALHAIADLLMQEEMADG